MYTILLYVRIHYFNTLVSEILESTSFYQKSPCLVFFYWRNEVDRIFNFLLVISKIIINDVHVVKVVQDYTDLINCC